MFGGSQDGTAVPIWIALIGTSSKFRTGLCIMNKISLITLLAPLKVAIRSRALLLILLNV